MADRDDDDGVSIFLVEMKKVLLMMVMMRLL